MNRIDEKFQELMTSLKRKTKEEVFLEIKDTYIKQSSEVKMALENYFQTFNYWGKLKEMSGEYESLYNRATSLKEHVEDYEWLYKRLKDYRSKKLLYSILNNWYHFDATTTKSSLETNYNQYWDLDIIKPTSEEVIVDIGSYIGDSILTYVENYGVNNYKKIYAYEITPESIEVLKNNTRYYHDVEIRKKAVLDRTQKVYMNINENGSSANQVIDEGDEILDGVSIDTDIVEDVSMIKMDIEGSEAKALIGCQNHIRNTTPKLLLSVYHNHEDLWKIPRLVDDINPNYQFYLRCYGSELFPTEIILYAIKNE